MIKRILKIVSAIIFIIYVISLSYFAFKLSKLNLIANKYLIIGYSICLIFSFLFVFILPKLLKIINVGIMILLISVFYKGIDYFTNTYDFIKDMEVSKITTNYSLVVLNNNKFNDINSLNNNVIGYFNDNKDLIKDKLAEEITYSEVINDNFTYLKENLLNNEISALCLENSYLNLIYEEDNEFKNMTKVIYTMKIDEDVKPVESSNNTSNPFILYISGIDQYGDINNIRGRSDVNILAVVNPVNNKILLVNTPRDYYVKLHNTDGLNDKLTHAGIYGIDMSMNTLEDLYDIDIDYYLRVNFDTLVNVVDTIDGIDVYSDSSFKPWTNQNVYVNEGWNHFDGVTALAYARERKTYLTGDNHRGQNQQQIITAIIDKVSKSSVLISKYKDILESLNGTFQTNMDLKNITEFIKGEINTKFNFEVESIQVTGYDSKNYTYSMSNSLSYVMEPNINSVNNAKEKIQSYLTT